MANFILDSQSFLLQKKMRVLHYLTKPIYKEWIPTVGSFT